MTICFTEAGFKISHLVSSGIVEANKAIAPVITGAATELPLNVVQLPSEEGKKIFFLN